MNPEPASDRAALAECLLREYGLEVIRLEHQPEGMVGQNYLLTCREGQRYFLKLYPHSRLAQISSRRLDFTLSLTRALFEGGFLTRLCYPIPTHNGALKATFQGMPLVLYPYIPGKNLMQNLPYPTAILEQAAELIAALHSATPFLKIDFPYIDDFTAHFEAELRLGLSELERLPALSRPGQRALRDLLLPQKELLFDLLEQMHSLADQMRRLPFEFVICHTDANAANLILSETGELYLVDWEGTLLAPAEHDLFIFTGEGFEIFLSHYRRLRPEVRLHPEAFAFYFYRRNLEDLTDWIMRILYENTTNEQDEQDLTGIQEDCINGWPFLADAEERMRVQLT